MGSNAGPGLQAIGLALAFKGTMNAAKGQQQADEFQAAELDQAAKYGDLKAVQTGATMTQKLNQTLGNIDVIRAASHNDPTSPTGAAYRDYQEDIGITQKTTTVDNILAQSRKQEAEAAYLRAAGHNALLAGKISAWSSLLGAGGSAASKSTFGLPGSSGQGIEAGSEGAQATSAMMAM